MLYGELMIRQVLKKQFSIKNEEIKLLKNDAGKPYIKGFPIHFNISHAGDFVVCVFSEQAVGIDIEQIKEIDLKIAQRFFCQHEYEDLLAKQESEQLDYFYSLWTLKESYIKWLGTGLSTPLNSFCFSIAGTEILCADENHGVTTSFKQFHIEGYKLSVCFTTDEILENIEQISIEDMLRDFN